MSTILVLLGPPGAGKGTQAVVLAKKFGWTHVSTGDMLREAVAKKTDLGMEAKKYMDRGDLVPDSIVTNIVVDRIMRDSSSKGFILDGYPRTETQALSLEAALSRSGMLINVVIYFETTPEISISRLSGRRVCKKCGANYHIKNIPPKKDGICDKCGGELFQREDDKESTVRNRLKVYEDQTEKLLSYYEKKGILRTVSGDLDVESAFRDLRNLFKKESVI
ncbi:MAG: adenylate kinase [Candidatus Omnitrophica bacterium CG07_land_8_20_14_0_80_42_15]|uniref:Adenylate kinase n=1 Tax=Candidatus Aquitaenariimonas noxiae TaxID=1974741 RepID=A0A2J0KV55_9BACT|nr:MAG: adenylate kinase [Candidatus Omnitrophica bacterium CG07_land_8_20_14_0_80_42_15]